MEISPRFKVKFLKDAIEFLNSLDHKISDKIQYNITIASFEVNNELFKKLNDNIWEFRTRYRGMAFRLFAFWDRTENAMVIATHGITKKTQKTPPKEISKAEEIMKIYYSNKNIK